MSEAGSSLAEVRSFTSKVFVQRGLVKLLWCVRRSWVGVLEGGFTRLAVVDVGQKIEVVVEKVWDRGQAKFIVVVFVNLHNCVTFARRLIRGFCSFCISSAVRPRVWTFRLLSVG